MSLGSPIPQPPPPTFFQRFRRTLAFYSVILLIIVVWAASSLVIAPVVQFGIDRVSEYIEKNGAMHQDSTLMGMKLSVPCDTFETLPTGCDGTEVEGDLTYGPNSVLYFWGRMPNLEGLGDRERSLGEVPNSDTDGVFYSLQKAFPNLPVGDAAVAFARGEMASYGAYTEQQVAPDLVEFRAAEGSAVKQTSFYAVYTRDDGLKIPIACFGGTCKLLQAPWHEGFAYGITINVRNAEQLPAIDKAVRLRLEGFVAAPEK